MNLFTVIPAALVFFKSIGKYDHYSEEILAAHDAGDALLERHLIEKYSVAWAKYVLDCFDITLTVEGRENIPERDGYVIISNHQGYFDIPAILAAFEGHQTGFMAKEELKRVPYVKRWIEILGGLYMVRGDTRATLRVMQKAADMVKNGFNMAIFPEGTRARSDTLGKFKAGSFRLATKAKAPIVPVTVHGSYKLFEIDFSVHKGIAIDVVISPPIETSGLDRKSINEVEKQIPVIIGRELDKILEREASSQNAPGAGPGEPAQTSSAAVSRNPESDAGAAPAPPVREA